MKKACWLLGLLGLLSANTFAKPTSLSLEAGSAHVVRLEGIKQVAVGNSQLIQANAVSASEVILFAKQVGSTTVDIWTHKNGHHAYQVTITTAGLEQRLLQVQAVLKEFAGVSARLAGQHIVIEGREVSSQTRKRLDQLLARYPDVVDLTSSIAWDQMVMLDVKVLELPQHKLREIGVHWQSSPNGGLYAGAAFKLGSAGVKMTQEGPLAGAGALFGMNDLLTARLQSMTQSGQAVLLAQPQLLARSGSPASFQAGGEVPYAFVDKDGKRTTLFKKYGVMLNVTPEIDRHGAIRAKVDVEVSSIDPTISTEAGPAIRMRKTSTEFNVKSGQTLVLGGFISHEKVDGQQGFAGVHTDQQRQVELAIFLTPVIVTPDHPDLMARVARAQTVEDWQIGPIRNLNVPVTGQPDSSTHQWHPAHPALSQWEQGGAIGRGNTYSFD
ncbi:type II and III secretion system protein family protein [Orrella daihaiensis]|uniref:Pilus assembly protein N-terminal domain-containing protein n=1 Tax=Orrella daihaiensis TaxID=2782176 RepID=A0ABY4AJ58_9BURK|nr:pilus assembly protein N-terminal domain-containing protein [Orrella daihaiensis]UOD49430.1 pilus assembly protein N-terminal domain-containing protein [Orrella daihaiensis]